MSTEKAPKKPKTTIQVSRSRGGGKKRPDLFARLRNQEHPLDSLLPVELEFKTNPDTRVLETETPETDNLGHTSLETRTSDNSELGHTSFSDSDTSAESRTHEIKNIGHPINKISDTQPLKLRTHENEIPGHPREIISDINAPGKKSRTHEKREVSDIKTPEKTISDTRDSEKADRKKYDSNYERKRKEDASRDRMNLRPLLEIGKKVRVFCAEKRLELTEFFELSALAYIENLGHTSSKNSDTNAPYDDLKLKIYKTKPSIINLYLRLTGNSKWKMNDDAVASAYNEIEIGLIELGILQTLGNRQGGGKINSFSYFKNEIDNWVETNPGENTVNDLLKHYRRRLGFIGEEGK